MASKKDIKERIENIEDMLNNINIPLTQDEERELIDTLEELNGGLE